MTTATSTAGNDARGFSLLELVLVLLLFGVAGLIVLPNLREALRDQSVKRSALGLAAAARELRHRALETATPQRLLLDLSRNSYRAAREREVQLPGDVRFAGAEGAEIPEETLRQFVFFPNGSVTGGVVALSGGENEVSYAVRLEPITGRIVVLRGDFR